MAILETSKARVQLDRARRDNESWKEGRKGKKRERERSRLVAMGCYVRRRVYINTVRCGRKSAGGASPEKFR